MKDWEEKKLGEVCKFIGGSQPSKSFFSFDERENFIRLIQIRDYKSDKNIVYIPKDKAKRFCDENDIMIGRYGPPVFQILKGLKGAYNVALMKAVPNEKYLSKEYAFAFLKYSKIQDYIIHLSQRAAGQTGVNKEAIEDYPILLPPLQEQQRIVTILDEAFIAIEKAKANTEQNLKNAKELFESELKRIFNEKGDGWEEKTLGEVIEIRNGKNQSSVISESGKYKIMGSAGNVMGFATDYICEEGTTIIGRKGNISKPLYIEEKFWNVDTAFGLYPKNNLNKKLVYYLCLTIDFASMNRGTTIPSLVKSELLKINIFIPTEKNQLKIVSKLDALREQTKKLEAVYEKKLQDLEELKKSVLSKAFSGEL